MEDFIFGTMATDALKLIHHRAERRGIQHLHSTAPRDPLPGEPLTLSVILGPDLPADHIACYYTLDGSEPRGAFGTAEQGQVIHFQRAAVAWDNLVWGYVQTWQAVIPGQPQGTTVRYRIGAWQEGGEVETFADWPPVKPQVEEAARAHFAGDAAQPIDPGSPAGQTFALHVDTQRPPAWAREAVIYQVFVDRFYPGDGRDWLQTADLRRFFGGTLWGVRDKLDHIAALGADCLWLSPTWPSPTYHGYDVTDYRAVEPRLGGEEGLRALIEAAHARGIRVLLDLVCNHMSNRHPIFLEAQADPASPYRGWFTFTETPPGYECYFGVASMPRINLAHPAARAWMIDNALYWLREFNVDGFRLDHANGPGPDFWADFRAVVRIASPDAFSFGEVVEPPDVQARYIGRLDGLLDFHMADMLRRAFGRRSISRADLERFTARHQAYFDNPDFLMVNFLDNHDMDRFLHIAGGDRTALEEALGFLMALPGPPVIYAGTEVGLRQRDRGRVSGLEGSREAMPWGQIDTGALAIVRAAIRRRREQRPWIG
ncbi:MAG: alpha-amylase family glycosyl hydrolase [Anaerolineae bacterium]